MRTYHQLTDPDRSGLLDQIGAQRRRVAERLAGVKRIVAVMSGKGGVGKSYVTAHVARALARGGRAAGVLDADLNGPTIPGLLQIAPNAPPHPPAVGLDGVKCISMGQFLDEGAPLAFTGPAAESFVWRGAMEASALREFLGDVEWGNLDVLLLDLPPGMQRYIELCDILGSPPPVLTVTIPTPESRDAVRRAMRPWIADRSCWGLSRTWWEGSCTDLRRMSLRRSSRHEWWAGFPGTRPQTPGTGWPHSCEILVRRVRPADGFCRA